MASMSALADMVRACTDAMVDAGLRCSYYSGWSSRSAGSLDPWGVICHHTASPGDIDSMLANGRSDLPGPLCTWALHADGSVCVIACGRANHAGSSRSGFPSNGSSFGIEATGPTPTGASGPSAFAWDEYQVMVGCIAKTMGWTVKQTVVPGHKESCDPPGRKVDPYLDMNALRAGASAFIAGNPPPGFTGGDDFVPWSQWSDAEKQAFLDDIWRMLGRGQKIDGSKPEQVADGSILKVREWQNIFYAGDGASVPAGSDTHPNNFKVVLERLAGQQRQLDQIVEMLTAPPSAR
jgi:N-acetylmuramoyl-L-alanine amidase-like protein